MNTTASQKLSSQTSDEYSHKVTPSCACVLGARLGASTGWVNRRMALSPAADLSRRSCVIPPRSRQDTSGRCQDGEDRADPAGRGPHHDQGKAPSRVPFRGTDRERAFINVLCQLRRTSVAEHRPEHTGHPANRAQDEQDRFEHSTLLPRRRLSQHLVRCHLIPLDARMDADAS